MHINSESQNLVVRYFAAICASFLVLMNAVCMLLWPHLFSHPHWGISTFGARRATLLPYYLGIAIIIFCLVRVAQLLKRGSEQWKPLRRVFWVTIALAAGIGLTSPMVGPFLFWAHIYLCLLLAVWMLGVEVWVLRHPGTGRVDWLGFALLLAGTVVVNLSSDWMHKLGLYTWGEMLFFLGVFICLGQAAIRALTE